MTARTTSPSRIRRTVALAAVAVGAALALPGVAHAADSTSGKTLGFFNDSVCTAQVWAGYQVRAEGTATRNGAKFFVYKDGAPVYHTAPTSSGFAAEFRSQWGNFPGAGWYQVCAVNKQTTLTYATVRLRTDANVPF
jgi:hypothetical protein